MSLITSRLLDMAEPEKHNGVAPCWQDSVELYWVLGLRALTTS
jgi:hypothetical protein